MTKNNSLSNEIFAKMPVNKAVWKMAIPTIISQLIVLIYSTADTYFVSATNNPHMVAATSLILPIFNVSLSIYNLAGIGGSSLISRLLGDKKTEDVKKVFSFSVYICILLAGAFSLGTLLFMDPLLKTLGANSETYTYARDYALCVIVFGAIPTVLSNSFSGLLRSVGESRKGGFGITMGGIINIILDPLFMFVLFPKGMEILAVGVATLLSNCLACVYFLAVLFHIRKNSVLHFVSPTNLPTREDIVSIFTVGIPSSVAVFLFDMDYMVIDRLMSNYGNLALAAIGIVLKVERLPLNVGIGLCQGMMPIVAYNYSARNFKRMNDTKNYSAWLGLSFAALSIILYELFAPQIMRFFINNAETISLGTNFLKIRVLATPLMFYSFYTVYLFNGFGKGGYALFLGVMRWMVFNIPMLFILNSIIGMYGLVWAQTAGDILNVILSFVVYRRFEKRTFPVLQ